EAHGPALRRAHALLPALREAAATPSGWAEYHPAAGAVEAALAALGRSVEAVRAVGPKRAADLARFGLATVEDLLYHLPFRYEDRRALRRLATLQVGEEATAVGEVVRAREGRVGRSGRRILEVVLRDGDGILLLVWFHQILYFSRRLAPGPRPTSRRSAPRARSPTARSSSTSFSSSSSAWRCGGAPPDRSRARRFRRRRVSSRRSARGCRSSRPARRSGPSPRSRTISRGPIRCDGCCRATSVAARRWWRCSRPSP